MVHSGAYFQAGARIFQSNGTWSDGDYAPDDPLVHGHPREMDLTVMIVILALTRRPLTHPTHRLLRLP